MLNRILLNHILNKIFHSKMPEPDSALIKQAFRLYTKNIVVGLFCSVFMMLFTYLQFVLIRNDASLWYSALIVLVASFASTVFLHTPFIFSVHRARITKLWNTISSKILFIAIQYAFFYSVFFTLFLYLYRTYTEHSAIIKFLSPVSLFVVFQTMLFKTAFVIINATSSNHAPLSLHALFAKSKDLFIEAALFNLALFLFLPFFIESFFLSKFGFTSRWSKESKLEYSRYMPVLALFFIFPFAVVLSYTCILTAVKKNT